MKNLIPNSKPVEFKHVTLSRVVTNHKKYLDGCFVLVYTHSNVLCVVAFQEFNTQSVDRYSAYLSVVTVVHLCMLQCICKLFLPVNVMYLSKPHIHYKTKTISKSCYYSRGEQGFSEKNETLRKCAGQHSTQYIYFSIKLFFTVH